MMLKSHRKQAKKEIGVCGKCAKTDRPIHLALYKVRCLKGYGIRGIYQEGCRGFESIFLV